MAVCETVLWGALAPLFVFSEQYGVDPVKKGRNIMMKKVLAAALFVGLTGCASLQTQTDEQAVMSRAEKRMTALQALNFEEAYTYMSPGYRAKKSLDRFKSEFAGSSNIVAFEVLGAECSDNSCVVDVSRDQKISVYIPGMDRDKPINSVTRQIWVKAGGEWGYVKLK